MLLTSNLQFDMSKVKNSDWKDILGVVSYCFKYRYKPVSTGLTFSDLPQAINNDQSLNAMVIKQ